MHTFWIIIITIVATVLAEFSCLLFYHWHSSEKESAEEIHGIDPLDMGTIDPNRKSGYYWVKYEGEWEVAFFQAAENECTGNDYGWESIWTGSYHTDDEFDEIIEESLINQHQ